MAKGVERRRSARLTLPSQFSDHGLAVQRIRLVDLSPEGARIEHRDPLQPGMPCGVDLPLALGRGRLTGRVVWTTLHRNEQTLEGERQQYYRSGLIWTWAAPGELGALKNALRILKAAQEG